MEIFLLGQTPIIILLILISIVIWFINSRLKNKKLLTIISGTNTILGLLVFWTIYGFLTRQDYTLQWGCILDSEPIFSRENMFYSLTALSLITIGAFIPLRRLGVVILTIELLFWLYKLFFIKGGYMTGIAALPTVSIFDTIALLLRLALIKNISKMTFSIFYLFLITFIIMFLKVQFFR